MVYFNKLKDSVSNNAMVDPSPPMIHQVNLSNFLSNLVCISEDSCRNSLTSRFTPVIWPYKATICSPVVSGPIVTGKQIGRAHV